jgi:prophage regulatory protein
VPRPGKQKTGSSVADAKHGRRTGADVRATWSPAERIVLEPEREAITGYGRQWWWQLELKGEVPKRIKLGRRRVGWLESELLAWRAARIAERNAQETHRDTGGGDARPAA